MIFRSSYPLNPLVLWLPSQKGYFDDPPHLQMAITLGLSTSVPSWRVTRHGDLRRKGPFGMIITWLDTVATEGEGSDVFSSFFNERAPEGQAWTVASISSESALCICTQGLSLGFNTFDKLRKHTPEWMHRPGCQTTVISPFVYSFL